MSDEGLSLLPISEGFHWSWYSDPAGAGETPTKFSATSSKWKPSKMGDAFRDHASEENASRGGDRVPNLDLAYRAVRKYFDTGLALPMYIRLYLEFDVVLPLLGTNVDA